MTVDLETKPRMTVAEIALMRELVWWRKANGVQYWRARHPLGRFVSWRTRDREVVWEPSEERPLGYGHPRQTAEWVKAETLTQAIDLIVALGYLPARFSSAYRAGWHAAQVWEQHPATARRGWDEEFKRLFHDPYNISFPAGEES
jgi:hypothetical protein